MGLLAAVAGGALQGLGQGIVTDAVTRRNEALAAMKEAAESARQQAGFRQQERLADVNHGYKLDEIDATGKQRIEALEAGGKITQANAAVGHVYKMDEIKFEQLGRQALAKLDSQLAMGRTEAEAKLRDQLEAGDFKSVVRGEDGTYLGVTDRGLVSTGVKADPTSADKNSNGGGTLATEEQSNALSDARAAWRTGGKKGPEPKASDFIGMTHSEYRQKYGGAANGPANGAATGTSPPKSAKPISAQERTALYTQALTKAANGDPRFKGKSQSQIQAIIDDGLRLKGYDL